VPGVGFQRADAPFVIGSLRSVSASSPSASSHAQTISLARREMTARSAGVRSVTGSGVAVAGSVSGIDDFSEIMHMIHVHVCRQKQFHRTSDNLRHGDAAPIGYGTHRNKVISREAHAEIFVLTF
jgi:hypothetical protein